jgi:hypothetical protein
VFGSFTLFTSSPLRVKSDWSNSRNRKRHNSNLGMTSPTDNCSAHGNQDAGTTILPRVICDQRRPPAVQSQEKYWAHGNQNAGTNAATTTTATTVTTVMATTRLPLLRPRLLPAATTATTATTTSATPTTTTCDYHDYYVCHDLKNYCPYIQVRQILPFLICMYVHTRGGRRGQNS